MIAAFSFSSGGLVVALALRENTISLPFL